MSESNIIIYQTEDGKTKIETRLEGETVWLTIQGTRFSQWATSRLREYLIKGFTMNDELLKQAGGGNYFDELLARIRDIRSSEKVFWRKVLDIYSTSIDYDPKHEISVLFFQTVQKKCIGQPTAIQQPK